MENGHEKLMEAIKNKNIVIVAGAGLSKDAPSNLPSWWAYNISLLGTIGQLAAEILSESKNVLNVESIAKIIPVTSVSDFLVGNIAGNAYYPLLSMLDGAKPNIHHFMLADLVDQGIVQAIITTNFDTLIERAFIERNVAFTQYDTPINFLQDARIQHIRMPDDYRKRLKKEKTTPIYKIHGSADKPEFAIDTVRQKLPGLSPDKTAIMKKIFSEYHIIFLGFSGEDFLFGSDYLPIHANTSMGITWVAHPGSTFNPKIKNLIDERGICVIESTLPDFYKLCKWSLPDIPYREDESNITTASFTDTAESKIRLLLEGPAIGKLACVSLCIDLLLRIDDKVNVDILVSKASSYLHNHLAINWLEGLQQLSLYSAIGRYYIRNKEYKKAFVCFRNQTKIYDMHEQMYAESGKEVTPSVYYEMALSRSTTANHIGELLLSQGDETRNEALSWYGISLYYAYEARHYHNIGRALFNISLIEFKKIDFTYERRITIPLQRFVAIMEAAHRVSKKGGDAELAFSSAAHLVWFYCVLNQKKLAEKMKIACKELYLLCDKNEATQQTLKLAEMSLEKVEDGQKWPLGHAILCDMIYEADIWEPFSYRSVLKLDTILKAKNLLEKGKLDECLAVLEDEFNSLEKNGNLEKASMIADCISNICIEKASGNISDEVSDVSVYIEKAQKYCSRCFEIDLKLGRIDYAVYSLAFLSILNSYGDDTQVLEKSLYQMDLCLGLCDDPNDCCHIVNAVAAACQTCLILGKETEALQYGELFMNWVNQNPRVVDIQTVVKVYDILNTIHYPFVQTKRTVIKKGKENEKNDTKF